MRIRAKDIAAQLGVSPATVSNALNGRAGVSDELRTTILETAGRMGYRTGKTHRESGRYIRLVITKASGSVVMDTQFFSELFESIQAECQAKGLELMMNQINTEADPAWAAKLTECWAEPCTGVIVLATETDDIMMPYLSACPSPLVVLDNLFIRQPVNAVVMNNFQAGRLAVEELAAQGHSAIGFIGSSVTFSNAEHRRTGYEMAMTRCCPGSQPDVWPVRPTIAGAYEDMKLQLASGRKLPTAFFACNDIMAAGAVRAIREAGLRVPEDVSIIGMDDTDLCLACNPQLTTIHVFRSEMGRAAVRMLLAGLPADPQCCIKSEISVQLVPRSSVAPGKAKEREE